VSIILIPPGDLEALKGALRNIAVPEGEIEALGAAVEGDKQEAGQPVLGRRIIDWLLSFKPRMTEGGTEIGPEVAREWLLEYLGAK
jgi:hypothetical protein